MAYTKPTLEGVGSASGVAWPLFGILGQTLSFGIGTAAALILGSACSLLFLVVSIPIIYNSYQNHKQLQQKLARKKDYYENKLADHLGNLFSRMIIDTTNQTLLIERLKNFEDSEKKLMLSFLDYLSSIKKPLNSDKTHLLGIVRSFLQSNLANQKNLIPTQQKLYAGFIGFIGAFGTIAGGCAGLTGMLMGLGLLASFSLIPGLGIAVLVAAALIGVYGSFLTIKQVEKNAQIKYSYHCAHSLSKAVKRLNDYSSDPTVILDTKDIRTSVRKLRDSCKEQIIGNSEELTTKWQKPVKRSVGKSRYALLTSQPIDLSNRGHYADNLAITATP